MSRTVLHVDMDAFYASVEERENPALRGRPVVVGSDPRQGRGRGVVAACNYEARRFGLHSAMPISRAWQRCPHAAYVRPHFVLYSAVSKKIFAIMERYTDLVEPISIDEAFLDVTASRKLFGDGPTIAETIKTEIRNEEALAASVGVAGSKFIAKLASDLEKPDGLVVVPPGEEREFLAPLDVRRLWGAGPKTVAQLHALGAHTIGGVARLGRTRLVAKFGDVHGARLFALSQGLDDRPVNPHRGRKSLSKESTFDEDVADREVIERTLLRLCVGVARGLRRKDLAGRTVTLKLRWESFETLTRQTTLLDPVDTTDVLWPLALELFRDADQRARRVRLIGIGVSGFDERGANQLSLFETQGPRVDERIASAVDRVTERFGNNAVMRAALLGDERAPRSPTEATEASD
jgi:nucleotidyltransferase/DNA polymerase involved in DNA repair